MRTVPLLAAVVAAAATTFLATAPAVSASPNVRYGIQDDAWLASGDGTLSSRLDALHRLGVDVVRFSLRWNEIAAAGPDQASWDGAAQTPFSPRLRSRGIAPVVTLVGAPSWANGGRAPNWAPRGGAELRDVRARGGATVSVGPRLDDLERAEPAGELSPDARGDVVASSSIQRTRRSTLSSRVRSSPAA